MKYISDLLRRANSRVIAGKIDCRCSSSVPSDGPNPALNHLPWADLAKMINETVVTKEDQRILRRIRPWPREKTIRFKQQLRSFRKLYLECESDPQLSLVVAYNENKHFTLYEDQLIGIFYGILWGLHRGYQLIEILNCHQGVCDFLRTSRGQPTKNAELVEPLRRIISTTIDEPPFEVRLLYKDFDLGMKIRPPRTKHFLNETDFLKNVKPCYDSIKQLTNQGFDEMPIFQKRLML